MPKRLTVKRNEYHDSIQLMTVSERLRVLEGVTQAMVAMATGTNKEILTDIGLSDTPLEGATADDLVVALETDSEETADRAVERMEALFGAQEQGRRERKTYRTLAGARGAMPDANVALITVPGEYAYAEARAALEAGLHVVVYSDNVPLEQDRKLKELAARKGLLCMGPDCGVCNVNGRAFLTSSVVRKGPVGIAGASGSGTQLVACLVEREGLGVSQAIGVGGKDLKDEVGGLGMLAAMDALEENDETKVIVLISRTPGDRTLPVILSRVEKCTKPVVVYFIGGDLELVRKSGALAATDLEDAAVKAVALANGTEPRSREFSLEETEVSAVIDAETAAIAPEQKYLRGLYCGGTFCEEAMTELTKTLGAVHSNAPLRPELKLANSRVCVEHSAVDLGDEEFTKGRPHPVIDPEPVRQAILREGALPEVAVLLLDFILGPAINPDPVGSVIEQIASVKAARTRSGGHLSVVASVCGTNGDPQNLAEQERRLREARVVVMPSNAQAARMAGRIAVAAAGRAE